MITRQFYPEPSPEWKALVKKMQPIVSARCFGTKLTAQRMWRKKSTDLPKERPPCLVCGHPIGSPACKLSRIPIEVVYVDTQVVSEK